MARILVVEDDPQTRLQITDWLSREGHLVEAVGLAGDGEQLAAQYPFDVLVLDWNLPDKPGISVCQNYRTSGGMSPILFLTAQGQLEFKEAGFNSGADDYLVKPFALKELSLRIGSLLRRPRQIQNDLCYQDWKLDPQHRSLLHPGGAVSLTQQECALIEFLFRNPSKTHSGKSIMNAAWRSDDAVGEDSVRQCVRRIRRKLVGANCPDLIGTVLGSGYRLVQ